MEVIANTTVISNFAAVGRLDILHALLEQVHISTEVFAEIQDGEAEDATFYAGIETHIFPISNEGWLRLTTFEGDDELRLFGQLPAALHRGEASCLAIAAQRKWAYSLPTTPGRDLQPVSSGLRFLAHSASWSRQSGWAFCR